MASSSNFDVSVRLTTIGTADLAASMKSAQTSTQAVATELNNADVTAKRLTTTIRGVTEDGTKYSISMKQAAETTKATEASFSSLSSVMGVATAAFATATAGLYAGLKLIQKGIDDLIKPGLDFNSFLEMNKLALGAMQLTFGQYVDAQGKAVDQTQQWSDATAQATVNQQLLIKQSLSSAVSIKELAGVFQMMYGAMLAGGAKSQQEMVTFAGVTADMAAVMGTSYERAGRQMTLALLGVTRTTGQLGAMLRSMGIDNATLKSWREQGTIVEELTNRLHAFVEMQPLLQTTWVGITTNMKTAWQQLTGALSGDVFQQIKLDMNDLLHSIIDFNTGKLQESVVGVLSTIGAGVVGAWNIATTTVKSLLTGIDNDLSSHGATWTDVWKHMAEGMVFLAEQAGNAALQVKALLDGFLHPIDVAMEAVRNLARLIIESLLVVSASALNDLSKVAGFASLATGGVVGAGIGPGAASLAVTFTKEADALELVRTAGNRSTQELNAGLAANAATALAAYTAIQRVGTAAAYISGGMVSSHGSGAGAISLDTYVPNPPKAADTSKLDAEISTFETKTKEMWDKANAYTETDLAQKLLMVEAESKKEIDLADKQTDDMVAHGASDAKAWAEFNDRRLASTATMNARELNLFQARMAADDAGLDASAKKKAATDEWLLAETAKLNDELSAVSLDYYTKQQGNIEKQYDAEVKAINKRLGAGTDAANAEIELAGKVESARMALSLQEENSVIGYRKRLEENAKLLVMTTNSVAGGLRAGWDTVMASLKTTTESVRDYVVGAWGDMATAFDSSFVAVLSGNLNSLKDVFKTFIGSLQKTFATFITDSILPKIRDALSVATGTGTYTDSQGNTVYQGQTVNATTIGQGTQGVVTQKPSNAGLYAGAGLMALAAVGQASGSNTFLAQDANYLSLAASLVSTAGGYVALAVAVIGSLIVAFTAAKADIQETFSGSAMADAIKKGQATGVSGTALGDATKAAVDLENSTIAFFASMFQKADPSFSRDILQTFKDKMIAYLSTIDPSAHAGGQADFNANITKIFTDMIPKALMHQYFGQTTNFADPGGIGGFQGAWNASGTTESAVDPNSPLVQFLTNLGFSIDKVNQIAGQIDLMTPDEFQKYFSGIVGAVIDFKNNIKNLSQSWAEIQVAISAAEHPDVVAQFATAGAAIVQTAKDLSLYSGQTQIDKANELNKTADQYYQSAFAALKALQDMMDQVAVQAQAFRDAAAGYAKSPGWLEADRIDRMRIGLGFVSGATGGQWYNQLQATSDPAAIQKIWDAFMKDATDSLNYLISIVNAADAALASVDATARAFHATAADYYKGADWLAADRTGRMATGGEWQNNLAKATSVEDTQAAWDAFMADANAQLTYLIGIVNAANAGMKTANDLAAKFGSIMADAEKVTTVYTIWDDVVGLGTQYAAAMKLSGQDQITALDAINASAATLYASLMQIIQGINSAETSIHGSIQNQIWQNNYSQAGTDPNRLGMINAQIGSLMGGLSSQMTAGDVSSSASQIQTLLSTYLGMFAADDPNRAAAVAQANAALAELDKESRARLEELKAQAKKDAEDAKKLVDLTALAFHDASVTATAAIKLLGLAVDAFRLEVDTKLHGFADSAIAGITALGIAVTAFQGLVDGKLTSTANNIVTELNKASDALVKAMGDFTTALEGPPTPPPTPNPNDPNKPVDPLIPAINTGATALGFFTTAVRAATHALGGATS